MTPREHAEAHARTCREALAHGNPRPRYIGPCLRGADLVNADLVNADLCGADLSGADMLGANLVNANLSDADLNGADLLNANLFNANLFNANLFNANLFNANLFNAIGLPKLHPDPRSLRLAVADHIEAHPELHDQGQWGDGSDDPTCGTPCCVAGLTCHLGGGDRGYSVPTAATLLLHVDGLPMPSFYGSAKRDEIIAALRTVEVTP